MGASTPVVLDIHADWCGPCKTLAPLLETAVRAQKGRVVLAKLDADANTNLVQQLRVTSLPTVLGVHGGRLVDSFTGMVPEAQVNAFVENLAKLSKDDHSPLALASSALDQVAKALGMPEEESPAVAEMVEPLRALAEFQPAEAAEAEAGKEVQARALALLARIALLEGEVAEAKGIAERLEAGFKWIAERNAEVAQALAEVKLASEGGEDGGEAQVFREALERDPKDAAALLGLARNRVAANDFEEAVEVALKLLRVNRSYEEEAAQKLLIDVFQALGPVRS